ncbi:hypothetical protein, partial [Phocaeicola sp.]|uniref:hypothetical protein n=1 Tax=Phocaeicola sp. TaxID=2773926 RepID=UPI003AF7713E
VFLGMGVNTFCRVYQVLSYGLLSLFVRTVTIVFGSGPYSLLQWTVRSIAADCNNLPSKKPWPTPGNGLFFPLFVI